jgi:hypothetical protein
MLSQGKRKIIQIVYESDKRYTNKKNEIFLMTNGLIIYGKIIAQFLIY